MTALAWVGVASLIIHGGLGAALTALWLLDKIISYTDFRKALLGYWVERLKRENPRHRG